MTTKNKDTNSSMQPVEDKVGKRNSLFPWEFYGMSEDQYFDIAQAYPEHFYSEEDLERFEQERIARRQDPNDVVNKAFEELLNA